MMRNRLSKLWFLVVLIVPFLLMLCLHIGIALGNYFGININVPNVDASTWFIFCGSYIGGTMTLAGVMITLRHERNIHQYEKSLESIAKEKDALGKAICDLNVFAPNTLYQRFNSLQITSKGYDSAEVAVIRQLLSEEMRKINIAKLEVMFFTDAYTNPGECHTCKTPCRMPTIMLEFQKTYETVGNQIFVLLQMIDSYIVACSRNATLHALIANYQEDNRYQLSLGQPPKYDETKIKEYERGISSIEPQQSDIVDKIVEINKYNQTEIPQLSALAREYIAVKQQNAYRKHFAGKKG